MDTGFAAAQFRHSHEGPEALSEPYSDPESPSNGSTSPSNGGPSNGSPSNGSPIAAEGSPNAEWSPTGEDEEARRDASPPQRRMRAKANVRRLQMVAWERRKAVDKTMAVGSLSRSSAADAKADGASKKVRAVMLEVRLNSISILNTICFAANLTSPPPHALTSTSSHSLSHLNDLSTLPPLPSLRLLPSRPCASSPPLPAPQCRRVSDSPPVGSSAPFGTKSLPIQKASASPLGAWSQVRPDLV